MPLIYGKTVMTTSIDIHNALSPFLSKRECFILAKECFHFWKDKYPDMRILIDLISNIGWCLSTLELPVFYSTEYITTMQSYMCSKQVNIWVYDSVRKKRRRVTLRIPTTKWDSRKTKIATFVNFIRMRI